MNAPQVIEHPLEKAAPEEAEVRALVPRAASPLDLPAEVFRAGLDRRKQNRSALMEWVRSALVEGVDFGSIPTKRGPSKPSLWKPGAEKICGMLGVTVHFPTLADYEQAALQGTELKHIIMRCAIQDASGRVVADGVGARSLAQDYGDINKALKMAEKSAHIDATLRMAGLSEVFTQDLEDLVTTTGPQAGPPVTSTHPSPSAVAGNPSGSAPPVRHNGASNPGEPIQWISAAQHRRLEALLKAAGLPRERVREWLAHRHPQAYPEGVRLNRIWVRHAEEIEHNIPRFLEALEKEREAEVQARQRQAAAREEALDWAADQFGWKGDLQELARIAAEQAAQAGILHRRAQAKDGHLDPAEVAQAERLAERARLLREFAADAHPVESIN